MILSVIFSALAAPLSTADMLKNISQHPDWNIAATKIEVAEASVEQATAPFTPTLYGKTSQYANKYPRTIQQHGAAIKLPMGVEMQASWEQGVGDFPSYDEFETKDGGELHLQLLLPLLDGLWVNPERTELLKRRLQLDIEKWEQKQQQLQIVFQAEEQYWKWVKANGLEQIAEESIELVNQRQWNFTQQYELGTLSRLKLLDNERERQQRKQQLNQAIQQRYQDSYKLSYFWREPNGTMNENIPQDIQLEDILSLSLPPLVENLDDVDISNRPDIAMWNIVLEQIAQEQKLYRRKQLPKVNLSLEQYNSLKTFGKTPEQIVGLKYEFAPMLREEKAKLSMLHAKEQSILLYQQKYTEKAWQEIRTIHTKAEQIRLQVIAQQEALELAIEVLELEQLRFQGGDGDLLDLIKRENNLLKAQSQLIKLLTEAYIVEAQWQRALGTLNIP